LFYSRHEENPSLYDPETGAITEQGQRTLAVLNALTGIRRQRLLEGKPAQAEGVIYEEWDETVHLVYETPICQRFVAGVDWGYRNPGVILLLGLTGDGAAYLIAQIYRTGETDDWWLERAKELKQEYHVEVFICDPSEPAYISKWQNAGINAIAGQNAVLPGISAVKSRLADNRLFIVRDNLRYVDEILKTERKPYRLEDELPGYVWADKKAKEQPVKEDDHACDALRYVVMHIDSRKRGVLFG